jgi:seryl-tRNA synthetase
MSKEIEELRADVRLLTKWVTELNNSYGELNTYLKGTIESVTKIAQVADSLRAIVKELDNKKVDKWDVQGNLRTIYQDITQLFEFRNKIEAYPKISIKKCKSCDHDTLFRDNPDGTFTCLTCGITYQKTHQEFLRVVDKKKE